MPIQIIVPEGVLTAEVAMGRAGIVLGLEVSRLARNDEPEHGS